MTLTILVTILSYTWLLEPLLPGAFVAAPMAVVGAAGLSNAIRTNEWGVTRAALLPGLRAAAIFTVPFAIVLLAAGAALGTLQHRRGVLATLGTLILWGAAQQWILQTVVLREAQRVTSRTAGVFVAALLFAMVHLPNPFLALVTFVSALGWCSIYDRHPNVLPLALSHAIGTLVVLHAFDDRITGRLRIGYSYLML